MPTTFLNRAAGLTKRVRHSNQLAKNTLWMLMGQGVGIVLQAVYFIIIARALGPDQYGAFVGATSLIAIFAPFVTLGSGSLIVKNVSRNPELFNQYWGNSLLIIGVTGTVFTALLCLISPSLLPNNISTTLVFCAAISDFICLRLLEIAGHAFQAIHKLSKTAQIKILPGITRVVAAIVMVYIFPEPNAVGWTVLYLIGTIIAASVAVLLVQIHMGSPKLALERIRPELFEGFCYSTGLSSQTIYNNVDKTMLARFSTLSSAGVYAAAYRIIDVAFVPIRSLLSASYAKFYQHGASGISHSLQYAKRLTPLAAIYGIIVGVVLILLSPLLPYAFGQNYAESAQALCWLAPLPFFKAMHYFAANSLSGAGLQSLRSAAQVFIAIFNFCGNLILIPLYSWKGAIASSLASDGLLMIILWTIAIFYSRRQIKRVLNIERERMNG
ncbi:oligosaccharide flippase family protein [Acaryochloris sp. IP29b_bin.148]|uniref:lipopolysaccharide biosynthesis protein n=1 Tax=Acaryochloris sp. IP29b_bin.148 TaxID=2969218 RepID=UPI002605907A|nr:oligosaccharide flippase family protein [Acaryochloris sp. IP29b_bin.148]